MTRLLNALDRLLDRFLGNDTHPHPLHRVDDTDVLPRMGRALARRNQS